MSGQTAVPAQSIQYAIVAGDRGKQSSRSPKVRASLRAGQRDGSELIRRCAGRCLVSEREHMLTSMPVGDAPSVFATASAVSEGEMRTTRQNQPSDADMAVVCTSLPCRSAQEGIASWTSRVERVASTRDSAQCDGVRVVPRRSDAAMWCSLNTITDETHDLVRCGESARYEADCVAGGMRGRP